MVRRYLAQSLVMAVLSLGVVMSVATGVLAQNGTKLVFAKALLDHECDDAEWHFVITGITGTITAPASIHVIWANGDEEDVPLDTVTGQVAHYATTSNLVWQVVAASAVIDEDWSGQFNLSHGPCDVIGPGKNTDLSLLAALAAQGSSHPSADGASPGGRHHVGTSGTSFAASTLPKTGDGDLNLAVMAAGLLGMGLLISGMAGRVVARRSV